jgi:mannose-6-phosphate isomerase-like protein (cupin superfamily)
MTTTPIDLFSSFVTFETDGNANPVQRRFDPTRQGWQLMTFHAETDADVHGDHWEIHTGADELVSCLRGGILMYFRDSAEEITVPAGSAVIVPRGTWHRIELTGPSDIMSVTVPRGSRLEQRNP